MEKSTKCGVLRSLLHIKYYSGDQIKKNQMGGARSTQQAIGEVHTGFWWEDPRERDHFEDQGNGWEDNIEMDI